MRLPRKEVQREKRRQEEKGGERELGHCKALGKDGGSLDTDCKGGAENSREVLTGF